MTISLITVTYNSGNTLFSTLQSVFSQTHLDIEYIIVDGVSKDHTIDVLKEYEPKFNGRLRWISEPDKGLYDAMNKGIRMATGDVVGILNSDDFFTGKDVLAQVARAFETDDRLAAVYGDVHFVHPDKLDKCIRYYSSKVFKRKLMRFGFMPAHPSFYLRRKYFGKFGCYKTDYRIAAGCSSSSDLKAYKHKILADRYGDDAVGDRNARVVSPKWIMKEHLRAFRENGIYTNVFSF